jgi:hypothetical protein
MADTRLGSTPIKAGSRVFADILAANMDASDSFQAEMAHSMICTTGRRIWP